MNRREVLLLLAIAAAGLCLRPPVIGLSPVLPAISDDFGKSETWLGVLSALPVFCFGLAALLSPAGMRLLGDARFLAWCLVVLAVSQVVRLTGGSTGMLVGTLIVGISIGGANVAVPALIKRWFPHRIAVATAWSSLTLVFGGSLAAGLILPIQDVFNADWRFPLVVFAAPAALIAIAWLYVAAKQNSVGGARRSIGVWRSRLAWHVTIFFGIEALGAFAVMVWMPTIAIDRGMSAGQGGTLLALSMASQAVGTLTLPYLIGLGRDERPAVVIVTLISAAGMAGLVIAPLGLIWIPVVLVGLGVGSAFAVGLALIGLRSANERVAAELSGMVQSVGYVIAGLGPLGIGALRTVSGDWRVPMAVTVVICLTMIPVGLPAARRRIIEVTEAD